MCAKHNGFLLFEILVSGAVLAIWLGSLSIVLNGIRHQKDTLITLEKSINHADQRLAQAFSGQTLDDDSVQVHPFISGLRLIQIPIGENDIVENSLWIVVP